MKFLVAAMEFRLALARPRLLALNVMVPVVLVLAISLGGAPVFHAAAVYTVLFTLFGTFGSSIPLVRDAEAGLFGRIIRAGVPRSHFLIERAAGGSAIDALQLLPALTIATLGSMNEWIRAVLILWSSIWIANLLGNLVAAVARSLAETALFSAVAALLLLHFSGVFRTPLPQSSWAVVEALSPFQALHETLFAVLMGTSTEVPLGLVLWVLVLPVVTVLLARPITRSLRATRDG
jgi:hypothetical protein